MWYHPTCLNNQETQQFNIPESNDIENKPYYCTAECLKKDKDKVATYSKGLINSLLHFEGYRCKVACGNDNLQIYAICDFRRDAIRCADGRRMDSYNKCHLIQFSKGNHGNLFRVLHYFQCNKYGLADGNVEHDLWHNACVNLVGN